MNHSVSRDHRENVCKWFTILIFQRVQQILYVIGFWCWKLQSVIWSHWARSRKTWKSLICSSSDISHPEFFHINWNTSYFYCYLVFYSCSHLYCPCAVFYATYMCVLIELLSLSICFASDTFYIYENKTLIEITEVIIYWWKSSTIYNAKNDYGVSMCQGSTSVSEGSWPIVVNMFLLNVRCFFHHFSKHLIASSSVRIAKKNLLFSKRWT